MNLLNLSSLQGYILPQAELGSQTVSPAPSTKMGFYNVCITQLNQTDEKSVSKTNVAFAGRELWSLLALPLCVLPGARWKASGPLPPGSRPSPPSTALLFTGLGSASDLPLLNSQKADEAVAQFTVLSKNTPMGQMPACFLKATYSMFHFAGRRDHLLPRAFCTIWYRGTGGVCVHVCACVCMCRLQFWDMSHFSVWERKEDG